MKPAPASAAVVLASLVGPGVALAADPFAACESAVRARPGDREAWGCFEIKGQPRPLQPECVRRLERHRAARPGDPFPTLALGRFEAGLSTARADTFLKEAAAGFARLGDAAGESQALASLARLEAFRGRPSDAAGSVEALHRLAAKSADPEPARQAIVIDALMAQRTGDYGKAWTLLAEADPKIYSEGPPILRRGALAGLAYVAWATGRIDEAIAAYRQLVALLRETGDDFRAATVAGDLLTVLTIPGAATPDERRGAADDLVEAARASGNLSAEAVGLAYLADFDGPGPRSAERVARALELARESGESHVVGVVLRAMALYGGATDPRGAEAAFHEVLAGAEARLDLDERARALVVRSRALWLTGPRPDAVASSLAAMDAAEATREMQPDSLTRARRFAQWARPYTELAGHLLEGDLLPPGSAPSEEDVERAFGALERLRARVLLDEMDASHTSADLFVTGAVGRRRDAALRELAAARQRLRSLAPEDPGRPDAVASIARLEKEADSLREEVARENPAFAAVRMPVFPSLRDVRARLAPDEALLEYALADAPVSDGRTWGQASRALVVTRDSVKTVRVPDNRTLGEAVLLFDDLLDRRQGDERAGSTRLYDDVVRDALATLPAGIRRLVVVPDRALYALPFAALRTAPESAPLGETFDISVVPSATLWWREHAQTAPAARRGVLAFADPGAPADGKPPSERAADAPALPPLRLARREASAAVRRVGLGSRLLTGSEAVETALRGDTASDYRVVHFAAHALLDDAHPDRSAIVLAPGREGADGRVHIREIAALKLPGSVVVASGCFTAAGLILGGEGPMGLARAFFQAGARAVVGSLRPLRDDEAAAFFDRFYAHLADGASVAGAVRLAQHDRIRAGAPAAAWAGIVALGDGSAVPFPGGTGQRWPALLGLGIGALTASTLAWRLRRRARRR